ncbi:MAG: hypothetical protein RLZ98_1672 [Pseudomonadota bacterium]|jgi:tripartite-type tricarboxylate transporter receptor subunit TctC
MAKQSRRGFTAVVAGAALALGSSAASAQGPEDFYKGRQMTMVVYSGAGSAYDTYGRFLVRYMGKYIPGNPTFVTQNMQGAGGLKAAEYIYKIAPKDGSVISMLSRGMPFDPVLGKNPIKIEPLNFTWLGSMNREVVLAISWHTAKVKTLDELLKTELLTPGTGAGADSEIIPLAYNNLVGTKFKIISGYRNTTEAALAMERGELDGIAYWSWSAIKPREDWLKGKKLNLLFHTGTKDHPELPGVPLIRNAVKDPLNKKALDFVLARELLGRPVAAPPNIPADRAKVLRAAFAKTLKDPEFLKEAEKRKIEIDLVDAAEVDQILKTAIGAPKDVIERVKQALGRK